MCDCKNKCGCNESPSIPAGPPGPAGIQGPIGLTGPKGENGINGSNGAPGSTGATGATGAKGDKGDTGNTGSTGSNGTNGTPGAVWYNGSGAPSGGLGINGDMYLDNDTLNYYEKIGGIWTLEGNFNTVYRYINLTCISKSTNLTVANNVCTNVFEMPFNGNLISIGAYVDVAGTTSSITTIDVNAGGVTILGTPITIDLTEVSSRTAATPPTILPMTITAGTMITVDVDTISGVPAQGLSVRMKFLEV